MKQQCSNCKYSVFLYDSPGEHVFICRRYPPASFGKNQLFGENDLDTESFVQPVVDESGWCGEFKLKGAEG